MKIKYLFFTKLTAIIFALTSCNVTDIIPEDVLTDATYWYSVSDLELYANNFYTGLGGANSGLDNGTDIKPSNTLNTLANGETTHTYGNGNWNFTTIRSLNYFMDNYDRVTGDPVKINQYVAEIRLFRAREYHYRVKCYGNYPWYDKSLTTADTELIYKAADPRAFVVDKIIEDLEFACANLPLSNNVTKGRMHKYVAYMELARVCLYEGTRAKYAKDGTLNSEALIQKASDAAKYVMDNGGYQIVLDAKNFVPTDATPLMEDLNYHAMFTQLTDISGNKEVILARAYIKDLAMHGLTRNVVDGANTGMSKFMMNLYLCRDGKSIAHSNSYLGDATLSNEVSNRDKRLYQTVQCEFAPSNFSFNGGFIGFEHPSVSASFPLGYNVMKHAHADIEQWNAGQCYTQWILYRYAETLLIYAEAMAELGRFDQVIADQTINKLRERGAVAPLDVANIVTDPHWPDYGHAISAKLQEIRRERAIELYAEGFRHDDIYRWRAAKLYSNPLSVYGINVSDEKLATPAYESTFDVSPTPGGVNTVVHTDGQRYVKIFSNITGGYSKWDDAFYLQPVPLKELSLNKNLVQTPGWE